MRKLLFLLIVIAVSSCSDWLDVQPKTQITDESLFKNKQGFEQAIYGAYTAISSESAYGKQMTWGFMEAITGTYQINDPENNPYQHAALRNYNHRSNIAITDAIWSKMYYAIGQINYILKNAESTSALGEDMKKRIKAELLGLRAFLHLDILRIFGPANIVGDPSKMDEIAMPYVTVLNKDPKVHLAVKKVLELIHKDLDESILLFEEDYLVKDKSRFNIYASQVTKARAYMWAGEYDKALTLAQYFVDENNIPWIDEDINLKGSDGDVLFVKESMFHVSVPVLKDWLNTEMFFDPEQNGSSSWGNLWMFIPTTEYNARYEVSDIGKPDLRHKYQYKEPADNTVNTIKFTNAKSLVLIRKPEMYYILAECLLSSKNEDLKDEVIDALKKVRTARRVLEPIDPMISLEDLEKEIWKEYYKEYCGEGQIFLLHKRLGMMNTVIGNTTFQDIDFVFSIPQAELDRAIR